MLLIYIAADFLLQMTYENIQLGGSEVMSHGSNFYSSLCMHCCATPDTVDREIFTRKIFICYIFVLINFCCFSALTKLDVTKNSYNTTKIYSLVPRSRSGSGHKKDML